MAWKCENVRKRKYLIGQAISFGVREESQQNHMNPSHMKDYKGIKMSLRIFTIITYGEEFSSISSLNFIPNILISFLIAEKMTGREVNFLWRRFSAIYEKYISSVFVSYTCEKSWWKTPFSHGTHKRSKIKKHSRKGRKIAGCELETNL